jgi:hypothetical protein
VKTAARLWRLRSLAAPLPAQPRGSGPITGHPARAEAPPGDAAEPLDPRVATMLPAQLLQPGELIILLLKPSPWFIVLEALGTLAVLAVLFGLVALAPSSNRLFSLLGMGRQNVLFLIVVLAALRLTWQTLDWLSRVYLLTDRRMVRIFGVLRIQVFECQLKMIQHTVTTFSIRERLFGLGTIGFATAGTAFTEAYWRMLARPLEVHRLVVQTLQRYR